MLVILAAVLTAAPIHIVAVHGPHRAAALEKLNAVPGVTTIDASSLHEYLLRTEGLLPMQDFSGFSAAPVKDWPAAAADLWTQGVAYCHTLVGPPPWTAVMGSALTCANRLSVYLWQQYAAQQKATRVFEVDVNLDERKGKARVRGAVWAPGSRDQLVVEEAGTLAQVDQTIERVLAALLAKKGALSARNVISELVSAALGDPFSGQVKVTSPVVFKKTCAAMPARITVTPGGVLAESLAARWNPAGAAASAMACTLTHSEHTEAGLGEVMTVLTTLLTCSSTIVSAELAKNPRGGRSLVDLVSERLLQGLATRLCK